jgi:myb proto-oncogene protein
LLQEDEVLLKLLGGHGMEEHFPNNFKWAELAKEMNTGRNGKQCRDRWQNYLRPGIKKGEWTRDEEELIKDMHRTFGPK